MGKFFFKGTPVAQGVGIGGIYVISMPEVRVNRENITPERVDLEVTNLEVAVCRTYIELFDLYNGFEQLLTDEEKRILDVYNAILDDVYFFDELKELVLASLITAEHAIEQCINKYISEIESSDNEYVKQRTTDLTDIKNRLIRNVFSETTHIEYDSINSSHIVLVGEINPTMAVALCKKKVQAVIVQEGCGFLSHAAIILRSAGIPTINFVDYGGVKEYEGQLAIADGYDGIIIIEPDDPEIARYKEICLLESKRKRDFLAEGNLKCETIDKYKVGLSANVSNIRDFREIKDGNIDGIGLVRTETMFTTSKSFPGELRQTITYCSIAKNMKNKPVTFRTLDIGGDKVPGCCPISIVDFKMNNNRGIRWSLSHLEDFRVQIRSIIKASSVGTVRVSFPMIESADEIIKCRKIIDEEIKNLEEQEILRINSGGNDYKKNDYRRLKVGAVVETRQAVECIDQILEHVDFISIGTNDLLNQILGINRKNLGNEIKEYFEPQFLNVLKTVISSANKKKIFVSICGEMASDPLATVVLIGMGADDLSVAPSGISIIKRTVRDLYYEVARELVSRVLECKDINEVMHELSGFIDCRF